MGSGNPDETYQPEPMRAEYLEREPRLPLLEAAGRRALRAVPGRHGAGRRALRRRHRRPVRQPVGRSTGGTTRRGASTTRTGCTPPRCCRCATSIGPSPSPTRSSPGARRSCCCPPARPTAARPSHPYFDPVWSRLDEAGVTVAFHIMPFWYFDRDLAGLGPGSRPGVVAHVRVAVDERLRRAPDHRHALGADLRQPLRPATRTSACSSPSTARAGCRTRSSTWTRAAAWAATGPGSAASSRSARPHIFKEFVRVAPYPEDDIPWIVENLGGDDRCLVMGSDFPHAEGLAEPADFGQAARPARRGRQAADHARQRRDALRPLRVEPRPGLPGRRAPVTYPDR